MLLAVAVGLCAATLAGALIAPVALAAGLRSSMQAAADAAALAAGDALAMAVSGTDAPVWDCAGVADASLRTAATRVAAANGALLLSLARVECDVTVRVRAARSLPGGTGAVAASARSRVAPGERPGTGPRSALHVPGAPLAHGTQLQALVAEADRIDRLSLPYVWGGGHQTSPAPPNGPFDCSGAVSRVLQAAGYPIPTLVSRQFMAIGRPGPGRVTVWAYDGHVFLTIDGRGWGTGSTPRGGAGWLPYATPYHGRFVARHLPEFETDTAWDPGALDLGAIPVGGAGGPPEVHLVSLGDPA